MKSLWRAAFIIGTVIAVSSCASGSSPSIMANSSWAEPEEVLVWVGTGESYQYQNGTWVRSPSQDYDFLVRQYRFENHWESLKIQNRTNPDYDGSAGPADQQHFFVISYDKEAELTHFPINLESTYGNGTGSSSKDFTSAIMEFKAEGVHELAPYNMFRISQDYDYERGVLSETVELFDRDAAGNEVPFVKIEEQATMFFPFEPSR